MRTILLVVLFLGGTLADTTAQTIYSSSSGGNWDNPNTWEAPSVPGPANNVVIRGTVVLNTSATVAGLTVESGAFFQNGGWSYTATVAGDVINNGTIRNSPDGFTLDLSIGGNLTNNGDWTHSTTYLSGNTDHTLTLAADRVWASEFRFDDSDSVIRAASDQVFNRTLWLSNHTFDMGAYGLKLLVGGHLRSGTVTTTGRIEGASGSDYFSVAIRYIGTPTLYGLVRLNEGNVFEGAVTVADTLENGGWSYSATVEGDVINNGTIRDSPLGWTLTLSVLGHLTNNGDWTHRATYLSGNTDHTLTLAADRVWSSEFRFDEGDSDSVIRAASDQVFNKTLWLADHTFDMGSYGLQLLLGGALRSGTVLTTGRLEGASGSDYFSAAIRYVGTPTLYGLVRLNEGNVFEGAVTVADTLENAGFSYSATVEGDVINNGTIRNSPRGWTLTLSILGHLTNNGDWTHSTTFLAGDTDHTLTLAADRVWGGEFRFDEGDSDSVIRAASDQVFNQSVWLAGHTFDMGAYGLKLLVGGHLRSGTVLTTGRIEGSYGSDYFSSAIRYVGTPTLYGLVRLTDENVFEGTVTVADTLENAGFTYAATFAGDVINNGTIRDSPQGWSLILRVHGNVTNNGTWTPLQTIFSGNTEHTVALAAGLRFGSDVHFATDDSLSVIRATTDLVFEKTLALTNHTLNMGGFGLQLLEGGHLRDAVVLTTGSLRGADNTDYFSANTHFVGEPTVRGVVRLAENNRFVGRVTVADTLENANFSYAVEVEGDVINDGVIRDSPRGWWLAMDASGSVAGSGDWLITQLSLTSSGRRNVRVPLATGDIRATGPGVILTGDNVLARLAVTGAIELESGGTLRLTEGVPSSVLVNYGEVRSTSGTAVGGTFDLYRTQFRLAAGALDSLTVSHYGNQAPETYGNALRSIWKLVPVPAGSAQTLEHLRLYYDDEQLGSTSESELNVYHSDDDGQTWRQVSSTGNITRSPDDNYVQLDGAPAGGTFVLSSYEDPVSVVPTIVTSVIGRSQIRVGPPNRYSIHYANNSDVASGDFLMQLQTGGGVHLRSVEPSAPSGVDRQSVPLDSLTYDGENEETYLWIQSMAPHEERTFELVLGAVPDDPGKRQQVEESEVITFLTVAAVWAGKALITKYVVDVTVQFAEEVWRPVSNCETVSGALADAVKDSFTKVTRRWTGYEKSVKVLGDEMQGELIKKIGVDIPGQDVVEVAGSFFVRGPTRYLKGEFKTKDCNGKETKHTTQTGQNERGLDKVTSWDPNEKVAPAGYGSQGHITSAGRMTYKILFENKKEATAPAWKIQIDDTLSTVFDPSTVVLEGGSHEGWTFTVDGQALHWEIEDIELPPNVTPPEGEGYVSFSVRPVAGLESGTALRNRAVIIFDLNKPILTNEVVNTLDFRSPVTVMSPLPDEVPGDTVTVRWGATDGEGESGVYSTTVFMSTDGGGFSSAGSSLGDSLRVAVDPNHTYVFYAISKDAVGNVETVAPASVSVRTVSGVSVEPQSETPFVFALDPAYPNPFNPITSISYTLPTAGMARLVIYDAVGRRVATLLDGEMPAGPSEVRWDAGRFASGVYFYRLAAGSFVQTRAMILMK